METPIMGYIATTGRIHSLISSLTEGGENESYRGNIIPI